MTSLHALRLVGLAGFGALIATSLSAQEAGFYYGGLAIGQSRARIDEGRITAGLLAEGLTTTSMTRDEKANAYKIFGGYQFNRTFAFEAGYFNLGKFSFLSTTTPAGSLAGQIKLQGFNLDLVGTLPLTERLSALGRVGAQAARAQDKFSGTGAVGVVNTSPSTRDAGYKFGAGLQYELSRSLWLRGEAERYRLNDGLGNRGGVNMWSLSLVVPFGRTPAPVQRVALAPVVVAPPVQPVEPPPPPPPQPPAAPPPPPAPPPVAAAPVVVAAPIAPVTPPPPPRRRVSFSAESLFTFDKSDLRPEGKAALDNFVKELAGTRFEMVEVEGHTDRLGSQAYNQALSQRRADAVKGYLLATGKVDAARVSAVGKGTSAPVTTPADCKGNKRTAKLIACLQPDRRVDIDVVGTR